MRVRLIIRLLEPVRIQNNQRQRIEKTSAQVDQRLESPLAAKILLKLKEQETGKSALAQWCFLTR